MIFCLRVSARPPQRAMSGVSAQHLIGALLQIGARQQGLAGWRREVGYSTARPAEGEEEALRVGLGLRDPPAASDHACPERQIFLVLGLDLRLREILLGRL